MRRISHDLAGVSQRIAKLGNAFEVSAQETQAMWRDAKGQAFIQQYTSEIRPTLAQLVSGVTQSAELFEEIAKRIKDPDAY